MLMGDKQTQILSVLETLLLVDNIYSLLNYVYFETKTRRRTSRPSVDMDASATWTACCDLDIWHSESNKVISLGCWMFLVSFIEVA